VEQSAIGEVLHLTFRQFGKSNLCRRRGISLASFYSSSLKPYILFPSFLPCQAHSLVVFLFSFYFHLSDYLFCIAGFSFLLRILPPAVGIYFPSIVVQALLL
jgi:hypothetical protein